MTSNEILKADVLDILFDNRNKQYGAYALRKKYNARLGLALAVSLSTALLLFLLIRPGSSKSISDISDGHDPVVIEHEITFAKKPEALIPKRKMPVPQIRQQIFVSPVIRQDRLVRNPPPDLDALSRSLISDKTLDGAVPTGQVTIPQNAGLNSTEQREPAVSSESKPVDKEPEFPGGQEAWLNFLRKNLSSPEDLQEGEKRTVEVRFTVDKDGTVTGFQIVQSAGKSFDNEVIRVLKKMPKWRPAIQNGLTVERSYTQPVTFIGVEQ